MKKNELIEEVAARTGCSKATINRVFETMMDVTVEHLRTEGESLLPGIGKLECKVRPARQGRNPLTGEAIQLDERKVVKFKPAAALKGSVQ